jgi:asparagine synthase (glutamine-hydrolysing)
MCGIAGFLSNHFGEAALRHITDTLTHRGPDAGGYFYEPNTGIGLGHRRLSILDLSAAANQPFYSQCNRYVMVYNGEVYNFAEIAVKYGIHARTSSDSEIIIESFAKAGIAAVNDFNGMFAIAIWDKEKEVLTLVRDRVGIKPFYYYQKDRDFAFASELKALAALPIDKTICQEAISNYLYLGYIPNTQTIYSHCHKIPPGHYAVIDRNGFEIKHYWKPEAQLTPTVLTDEAAAKKQLKELLESSVKYCLISDVPLGVFLSGGIDSSTVAAIAQQQLGQPVNTFSIGFKEAKYNEAGYARAVAEKIGSRHHEFTVSEQDAMEQINNLTGIYDEPYADTSAIPTLLLSKLTRSEVTVALCGDGGDELFMGYGFYHWAKRLSNPLVKAFRKPIAKGLYTFGSNKFKRGSFMFEYPADRIKSHIFSQEQYYFTTREIRSLLVNPVEVNMDESLEASPRKLSVIEEQALFDIKNYLPEELLVKVDRASMQHSLEVRVPLLDYRLVAFALNLSDGLKMKDGTAKYLLKEALYDYLPRELFDRPKWGFSIPLRIWLGKGLKYLIDEYLSEEVVHRLGLVNYEAVKKLKAEFFAGKDYQYNKLWLIIALHKWMIQHQSATS